MHLNWDLVGHTTRVMRGRSKPTSSPPQRTGEALLEREESCTWKMLVHLSTWSPCKNCQGHYRAHKATIFLILRYMLPPKAGVTRVEGRLLWCSESVVSSSTTLRIPARPPRLKIPLPNERNPSDYAHCSLEGNGSSYQAVSTFIGIQPRVFCCKTRKQTNTPPSKYHP